MRNLRNTTLVNVNGSSNGFLQGGTTAEGIKRNYEDIKQNNRQKTQYFILNFKALIQASGRNTM